jgi:hypothetical protein
MALQERLLGAPVEVGPVPFGIPHPLIDIEEVDLRLVADRERALLRIDGVAQFAIDRGERVTVEPYGEAPGPELGAYLNSTITSILLGQRGQFALHANAIRVGGAVVLIAGHSGSGKSSTATRLLQRGHEHLTDDLSLLRLEEEDVVLHPTDRGLRLTPALAARLGVDLDGAEPPVHGSDDKFVLRQPLAGPAPVDLVVILTGADERFDAVECRPCQGAPAAALVLEHVYRGFILRDLWPQELFVWVGEVAARLPVEIVFRPADRWTLDEVVDRIEASAATRQRESSRPRSS